MEHLTRYGRPIVLAILTILAVQSILQVIWYYAGGRLTGWTDVLSTAMAIVFIILLFLRRQKTGLDPRVSLRSPEDDHSKKALRITHYALLCLSFLSVFFIIFSAWSRATTDAIRTPWPLMPHGTLFAIGLIAVLAILLVRRDRCTSLVAVVSSLALLSVTLIAPLLYKIGFGFDGFLHHASEKILLMTGTLNPHPPYYLGQYVFVTWLTRITHYALRITTPNSIDIFLVPISIAFLPLIAWLILPIKNRASMIAFLPLLIPLTPFIATTPQSFAYVLGMMAIFLALAHSNDRAARVAAITISLWALVTHPLAGLPFFFATLGLSQKLFSSKIKWLLALLAIVSGPLALTIAGLGNATPIYWNFSPIIEWLSSMREVPRLLQPPFSTFVLWVDWILLVQYLSPIVLLIGTFLGVTRDSTARGRYVFLTVIAFGLVATGALLKLTGDFSFLIDYERGNYAERFFILAQLFLLIPALAGYASWWEGRRTRSMFLKIALIIFLIGWQAAHAYLALPRHDAAMIGHGWSVGRADQEAVRWIDRDARGEPYTVLANQSVSAAAIEAFGFKRYTSNNIFYYPIPTGGPLYQMYLNITNKPALPIIKQAANLGESSLVYVVLNDYWWNAQAVAEQLTALTTRSKIIENGKVKIYKFELQ
ncbi:MAG: hypothetical protein Q7N87_04995 [Candidatus Uhrbacteria bacterium]|nr:hypothetical protein [Candidatus Uhrbacteria bacterium]MDP3794189.1 hypothetical protein [Candidatus Uhrbacteria bacterium]